MYIFTRPVRNCNIRRIQYINTRILSLQFSSETKFLQRFDWKHDYGVIILYSTSNNTHYCDNIFCMNSKNLYTHVTTTHYMSLFILSLIFLFIKSPSSIIIFVLLLLFLIPSPCGDRYTIAPHVCKILIKYV